MRRATPALYLLTFAATFVLSASLAGQAQNREKFVISARAGGINAVTGQTSVHGKGNAEWQQLTIKEDLSAGDVVSTAADGRVEMLLNPGSYLRVGENSEFELTDNSPNNLEIRLIRGTAIVEVTGADDTELLINITTPHTRMAIVRRGLYRVNVLPGDATELIVRKGRVLLADSQTKVKGGTKMVFNGSSSSMAKLEKLDKKNFDGLESWSKQRAETVAQANRKIPGRDLNLLMASFNDDWSRRFYSGASGIWVFNRRYSCFTFLPFYMGWGSPYGGSYSSAFYDSACCGRSLYGGRALGTSSNGSAVPVRTNSGGSNNNPAPASPPPQPSMPSSAPRMREEREVSPRIDRMRDPL